MSNHEYDDEDAIRRILTTLREIAIPAILWGVILLLILLCTGIAIGQECNTQPPDGVIPPLIHAAAAPAAVASGDYYDSIDCQGEGMDIAECAEELARRQALKRGYEDRVIEVRNRRATLAAGWCQAADAITTIVALEQGGFAEGNPALSFLNSDDSTERYLGMAAFVGLKWGLVRLARSTPSTADDWILAAMGCGAATWNAAQMSRGEQ